MKSRTVNFRTMLSRKLPDAATYLLLGVSLILLQTGVLVAQDVSTSFEFNETGDFTLGTAPKTVTFSGGEARTVGVPSLYVEGHNGWIIGAGQTGTISFRAPAREVAFFFKDETTSVQSILTVFGVNGEVIATFNGTPNGPDTMGFTFVQISNSAVSRITLQNRASGGGGSEDEDYPNSSSGDSLQQVSSPFAVIDNFSFTAVDFSLSFAQFADGIDQAGNQTISQITLINPSSSQSVTGKIEIRDDPGTLAMVDLNGEIVAGETGFTIGPNGSADFATDGQGAIFRGSVNIFSDGPVEGVILFEGNTIGVAGLGRSDPFQSFLAPVEINSAAGITTGVAVMDLNGQGKTLTAELFDQSGNLVAQGTFSRGTPQPLPANGHLAILLEEMPFETQPAPDLSQFKGILKVTDTSGGQIAGLVLRLDLNRAQLSSLPVVQAQ